MPTKPPAGTPLKTSNPFFANILQAYLLAEASGPSTLENVSNTQSRLWSEADYNEWNSPIADYQDVIAWDDSANPDGPTVKINNGWSLSSDYWNGPFLPADQNEVQACIFGATGTSVPRTIIVRFRIGTCQVGYGGVSNRLYGGLVSLCSLGAGTPELLKLGLQAHSIETGVDYPLGTIFTPPQQNLVVDLRVPSGFITVEFDPMPLTGGLPIFPLETYKVVSGSTFATVNLLCTGTPGTAIGEARVQDVNGLVWDLASPVIGGDGTVLATATCETFGAITPAAPNTVNNILTPVPGWSSATNPNASQSGQNIGTQNWVDTWGTFGPWTTLIVSFPDEFANHAKVWINGQAPANPINTPDNTNLPAQGILSQFFIGSNGLDPFVTLMGGNYDVVVLLDRSIDDAEAASIGADPYQFWGVGPPAPPSLTCGNPPGATVGVPYSHTFPASGGTPPYTFAITNGSLPPGITLDPATGIASGTPTDLAAPNNILHLDPTTLNDVGAAIDSFWESGLVRGKNDGVARMIRVGNLDIWVRGGGVLNLTVFGPDKTQSVTPQLQSSAGIPMNLSPNPGMMGQAKFDLSKVENYTVRVGTNTIDAWWELSGFTGYTRADLFNR